MDSNRLIALEELEIGDDIIISCYSNLRYYRIVKKPEKNIHGHWKRVKVSEHHKLMNTGSNFNWYRHIITPEDHNNKKTVDLSYRDIWLVSRNNF